MKKYILLLLAAMSLSSLSVVSFAQETEEAVSRGRAHQNHNRKTHPHGPSAATLLGLFLLHIRPFLLEARPRLPESVKRPQYDFFRHAVGQPEIARPPEARARDC